LEKNGKSKDVEIGAVIWVHFEKTIGLNGQKE